MKKTHKLRRGVQPVQSTCSKCSEVLPSRQKLVLHMKIAHRAKVYTRGTRGRPGADVTELRGINEKFTCEVDKCGKNFELASLLRKHLESVHEETEKFKTVKCCYCRKRKKFSYRQTYEMHMRTAHKTQIFGKYKCDVETCKVEPFSSMDALNEHLKSHLQEPESGISEISFCEKCDWGFARPEWRDLHQLCHTSPGDDGKMNCPQCSERFGPDVRYLQNHFNIRHGLNMSPFKCDLCESTFLFERYFDRHKYNHIKNTRRSNDWICELCGAKFSEKHRLNTHMIRHEEPKFSCDVCGALFKFKNKLNDHKKHMHDPNRSKCFICSECGKGFYSNIGLRFHFDSAHKPESEWELKCPKCPSRFYRNLYLGRHLKTCDGSEEEEKRRVENEMMDANSMGNETKKAEAELSTTGSPQAHQNEFEVGLSSSSMSQQPPITIQCNYQSNDDTPPESQELTEMALSPFSQDPPHDIHLNQSPNQFSPKQQEEMCDLRNPSVQDDCDDQVKIEIAKESSDDETPDNFGNEDDSDWSRGGASPMSDGVTVSSDDDCEATDEKPSKSRWNLRRPQVVRTYPGAKQLAIRIKPSCPECSNEFPSEFKLWQHVAKVHEKEKLQVEKTVQCCFCSRRYAYQQTLDMHLKTNHVKRSGLGFKCDVESCEEEAFVSMEKLNEHLQTHLGHSEKISFCEKCHWGFARQELRDLHQLDHIAADESDRKFACPQCSNTFTNLHRLQCHFNKKHGLNLERFPCASEGCDKSFFTQRSLQAHKRWHTKVVEQLSYADLKCDQCGVTFVDGCGLATHLNSATGHLFCCMEPGCDQKFDTNRKLKIHITMKHMDSTQREWVCELCAARFPSNMGLHSHMKNHVERKYTCEICGASFKRKDKLPLHMDSKHNPNRVKSWVCSLCGKSYHTVVGLQYHTDSEHKKESEWHLKCPHCPRRFYRTMYFHRHLKTCKGDESTGPAQTTAVSSGSGSV